MKYFFKNLKQLNNKYDDDLLLWRNQDYVRKMMITKKLITKEEHNNYLNKVYNSTNYNIYIGFKNNNPFGVINIWEVDPKASIYEYGYYLINEKDLNSGLGILMEYFAIEKIFQINNKSTIKLNTFIYNKKTINLHKRFGYKTLATGNSLCIQTLNYKYWIESKIKIKKLIDDFLNIDLEVSANERI